MIGRLRQTLEPLEDNDHTPVRTEIDGDEHIGQQHPGPERDGVDPIVLQHPGSSELRFVVASVSNPIDPERISNRVVNTPRRTRYSNHGDLTLRS